MDITGCLLNPFRVHDGNEMLAMAKFNHYSLKDNTLIL